MRWIWKNHSPYDNSLILTPTKFIKKYDKKIIFFNKIKNKIDLRNPLHSTPISIPKISQAMHPLMRTEETGGQQKQQTQESHHQHVPRRKSPRDTSVNSQKTKHSFSIRYRPVQNQKAWPAKINPSNQTLIGINFFTNSQKKRRKKLQSSQ